MRTFLHLKELQRGVNAKAAAGASARVRAPGKMSDDSEKIRGFILFSFIFGVVGGSQELL